MFSEMNLSFSTHPAKWIQDDITGTRNPLNFKKGSFIDFLPD